jgi:hypothetical protein
MPSCDKHRLMILVIGEMRMSRQSISKNVGIGSSEHDLTGDDLMSFRTSVSETGSKLDILACVVLNEPVFGT